MGADVAAVVVAAGSVRRMGGTNKALLPLSGKPVLSHVLDRLRASSSVATLTVVMNPADCEALEERWQTTPQRLGADRIVGGGTERWLSSRNGCTAAAGDAPLLLVHDAARALTAPSTIDAVTAAAREQGAAIAACPLGDTLKRAAQGGRIAATIPREGLWCAQTPQVFRSALLLEAFTAWQARCDIPTDEAMMVEALGHAVQLVPAPTTNFKLTTPPDLALAEALLAQGNAE